MILKEIKLNVLQVLQSIMAHRHGATVPNRESGLLLGCLPRVQIMPATNLAICKHSSRSSEAPDSTVKPLLRSVLSPTLTHDLR